MMNDLINQNVEYEPKFQSRLPFARKSNQNYFDNSYIGNVNSSQNQSWHQNSNQNNNRQQQNSSNFQIPKSACMIRFQPTTLQATCRALCLAMIVVDLCSGRLPTRTSIAIPTVHRIKPIITTIIDRLAMLRLKLIGIWKSWGFQQKRLRNDMSQCAKALLASSNHELQIYHLLIILRQQLIPARVANLDPNKVRSGLSFPPSHFFCTLCYFVIFCLSFLYYVGFQCPVGFQICNPDSSYNNGLTSSSNGRGSGGVPLNEQTYIQTSGPMAERISRAQSRNRTVSPASMTLILLLVVETSWLTIHRLINCYFEDTKHMRMFIGILRFLRS